MYRLPGKRKAIDEERQNFDLSAVQAAHQFVRKFPDSTKAVIELGHDEMAVAVLLLIQQPNAKTVQVKKDVREPPFGFKNKEESVSCKNHIFELCFAFVQLCAPQHLLVPIHLIVRRADSTLLIRT